MQYCPECGARLEPGDSFCINCGAALEMHDLSANKAESSASSNSAVNNSASTSNAGSAGSMNYSPASETANYSAKPKQKKSRRTKPWVIVLSVVAALAVIALAAFLILRNSKPAVLLRAANATIEDLEKRDDVKKLKLLADGGSIEATADLSQLLPALSYLDLVDAKITAETYYSKADTALVVEAAANVSGLNAIDLTAWITSDGAVIRSNALLGSKAYRISFDDYYKLNDMPEILRAVLEKTADNPASALTELIISAFRYGESYKNEFADHTVIRLTLDRKAMEKILNEVYGVNADISPDYILRYDFTINSNNRLTGIALANDYVTYSVSISPEPASADQLTFALSSDVYDAECSYKITNMSPDNYSATCSLTLNGEPYEDAELNWNQSSGAFKLSSGGVTLTPGMNVIIKDQVTPAVLPGITEEISLHEKDDVYSLAETLNGNVGSLVSELGLMMPFSLEDLITSYSGYVADYLSYLTGGEEFSMTREEFEEEVKSIAQSVAESIAYDVAAATAEAIARETSESVAADTAAAIAKEVAESAVKAYISSTPQVTTGSVSADSSDSSETTVSSSKGKMYSEVAGNYVFEEGASYGVTATAKFDDKGNYSFTCKSLLFNVSDKGTYTVDEKGNIKFDTKTSYKATGVYSSGKIKLTVAGIATVELKKQ